MPRPFAQVDVSTSTPYHENHVAVLLDGDESGRATAPSCFSGEVAL